MVRVAEQERVRLLLIEAVTALCQRGLPYESKLKVQGLLGITLDDKEIFLVDIKHEVDLGNKEEVEVLEESSTDNEEQEAGMASSPRRRKRRKRRSGSKQDGDNSDEPQLKRPSSDSQEGPEIKQETDIVIKEEVQDVDDPEPGGSTWPLGLGEDGAPVPVGQPIPSASQQVGFFSVLIKLILEMCLAC